MLVETGRARRTGEVEWRDMDELASYLRRVVGPRCRDENEVDDVVQEACVRAARYRRGLANEASLKPWAARIALNVLAGRARRAARRGACTVSLGEAASVAEEPLVEPPDQVRVGPWLIGRRELLELLERAVGELLPNEQRLLRAYYGGGESCRRAASVCELEPGLAKVKLFRVRRRLARLVRRHVALSARAWVGGDGVEHPVATAHEGVA